MPTAGAFAAADFVDGLLGAAPLFVFVSAGAMSAMFFLVGISAFRSVGPAAFVAACRVGVGEALGPGRAEARAAADFVAGVAARSAGLAAAAAGLATALGGRAVDAAAFAGLVRFSEAGWTAVRAAALDAAAGLAVAGLPAADLAVAARVGLRLFATAAAARLPAALVAAGFRSEGLVAPEALVDDVLATAGFAALLAVVFRPRGPAALVFGGMMPLLDRRGR